VKQAIGRYSRDFIAIVILGLIGLATLFVILSQQASALPSWFPILGQDSFRIEAEFQTAQAVTPGQGQSVNMAGVKIGDVAKVELEDGVAVVSLDIDPDYASLIHDDATALLRPRTGLQDMTVELDAGSDSSPEIEEDARIGLASTKPQVNVDQILASLDGDTQAYLRLLLAGGAEAFDDGRNRTFSRVLRRLEPTTRDIAKINVELAKRRENLKRVITNFGLISKRLAGNDVQLADFVSSQDKVFGAYANQSENLKATLRGFPGALEETRKALDSGDRLSAQLKPALEELIPSATALKPALEQLQPFFQATKGPVKNQIRPFTKEVQPVVNDLKNAAGPLNTSSKELKGSFSELNSLLNGLAYNPPGPDEGYLFYLSWLNHNSNSAALIQDGEGPLARSMLLYSCNLSTLSDNAVTFRPSLRTARYMTRLPPSTVMPQYDPLTGFCLG
jgi:phospholipid/cholesterol/gamma-HCH transport system substrate-binding protein